jgi:hypothetical protein
MTAGNLTVLNDPSEQAMLGDDKREEIELSKNDA